MSACPWKPRTIRFISCNIPSIVINLSSTKKMLKTISEVDLCPTRTFFFLSRDACKSPFERWVVWLKKEMKEINSSNKTLVSSFQRTASDSNWNSTKAKPRDAPTTPCIKGIKHQNSCTNSYTNKGSKHKVLIA